MTEPEALTGVIEPPMSGDVAKAITMLNERKSVLLDTIVEQKKISQEAMAKVKSARQELVDVDRLINASVPRRTKPRPVPAAKKK